MRIVLPDAKTYEPVGRCIYCSRDQTPLTREHIIPKGLRGCLILPQSSCEPCRQITHDFETFCLRSMFFAPRVQLGMMSKDRREPPPDSLRVGRHKSIEPLPQDMEEAGFYWDSVPIDEFPFYLQIPRFDPPGLLLGNERTENYPLKQLQVYNDERFAAKFQDLGKNTQLLSPFDPYRFCRMIAKIAHGAAIAELGPHSFRPLLQGVILGSDKYASYLVGNSTCSRRAESRENTITLTLKNNHVVAYVRLFAKFGLCPYEVVVGEPMGDLARWHLSAVSIPSLHVK